MHALKFFESEIHLKAVKDTAEEIFFQVRNVGLRLQDSKRRGLYNQELLCWLSLAQVRTDAAARVYVITERRSGSKGQPSWAEPRLKWSSMLPLTTKTMIAVGFHYTAPCYRN